MSSLWWTFEIRQAIENHLDRCSVNPETNPVKTMWLETKTVFVYTLPYSYSNYCFHVPAKVKSLPTWLPEGTKGISHIRTIRKNTILSSTLSYLYSFISIFLPWPDQLKVRSTFHRYPAVTTRLFIYTFNPYSYHDFFSKSLTT